MQLTSNAFKDGQPIPEKYSGDGDDKSPALSWSGVPEGANSLALICDDPDAPTPEPWVHWVIWNIPPETGRLPEGVPRKEQPLEPRGARQGTNSFPSDNLGYRGPAPPPGHGTHHYHFKLYALDTELNLEPGASKEDLLGAVEGHVLAEAEMVGTYER